MEFFGWLWTVFDGLYHPLVRQDAVIIDDIPEEMDSVVEEVTFLQLQILAVLAKLLQDLHHVVAIFGLEKMRMK